MAEDKDVTLKLHWLENRVMRRAVDKGINGYRPNTHLLGSYVVVNSPPRNIYTSCFSGNYL